MAEYEKDVLVETDWLARRDAFAQGARQNVDGVIGVLDPNEARYVLVRECDRVIDTSRYH